MKRSTIISLFDKVILNQLTYYGINLSANEINAISEDLTSSLEGLGVFPPETVTMDQITVGSKFYIGSIKTNKGWEDEN